MSMVTGAVRGALEANSFFRNSFVRNYESLISFVRSTQSLVRFLVETPTHMPEFLKQLPGNFQNYFPTDALKGVIDNKVLPFEVFLGKFKDHLTFVEVTDRTAKFYDEVKKVGTGRTSTPKLISSGTQALQKGIETVLLGDKWNLWNLARFSFLNLGYVRTFKEVCVIVASTASAIVNQRDKNAGEVKVSAEQNKLSGKLANQGNLGNHFNAKTLTSVVQKMNGLQGTVNANRVQFAAGTLTQAQIEQYEEDIKDLEKAKTAYITKFFVREDHLGNAIVAPGNVPADVQGKITAIAAGTPTAATRQSLLLNYKVERAQIRLENAENNATKARISRNFDISKIVIVILGLTATVGILTQVAATVGVTLVAVNGAAWVTGLAVGLLGAWKSYHLAFYGTPKEMPRHPLL